MKITKLEHSGFIVEKNNRAIAIDPVEFESKVPEIANLDAIVITHQHGDHCQLPVIEKLRATNPNVVIFTTFDNAEAIPGAKAVKFGDRETVGEFELEFFSISHAEIVTGMIPCQNIGVLIDGAFAHLGDSLDMPPRGCNIIALANAAPWLKTMEAMEYITKCEAKIIIPCHDAVLSNLGKNICNNWIKRACEEASVQCAPLQIGESLEA